MLYENPRNDNNKEEMGSGLYLVVNGTKNSENTSSIYALVSVYDDIDDYPIDDGWISLSSNNFVVDNY